MTAGDSNVQIQVYLKTFEIISERIRLHPENWIPVADVASIYSECFFNLRAKLAENEILSPYMLNLETFIARQNEMSSDFIEKITNKIARFSIEEIETIITGIDDFGPHIFVVRNGVINCADRIGFDSIGIGSVTMHYLILCSQRIQDLRRNRKLY